MRSVPPSAAALTTVACRWCGARYETVVHPRVIAAGVSRCGDCGRGGLRVEAPRARSDRDERRLR